MAQLLVRNLDPEIKERLRQRAALNGHSMEAEARLILRMELEQRRGEEDLATRIARIMEGARMDFDLSEDEPDIPFVFPDE